MADEIHPIWKPLLDFQAAMGAGAGWSTLPNDPRVQKFDELRTSRAFEKSGLANVADNLMENIQRLCALADMPSSIFNYGRRYQEVLEDVNAKVASVPVPSTLAQGVTEEQFRRHKSHEGVWKWILGNELHESEIGWMTNSNDVAGFAISPEVTEHVREEKRIQIGAFCASLLIQAWTLFEVLSEDLWEAALNAHPTVLGELKGKLKSKFKGGALEETNSRIPSEPTLRISFNELQKCKFNVRSQLGTILKERNDIGFRSLYDIRASYHRAFSQQNATIVDVLDTPGLQYAAAVRNLLIHKRGIVDKEFNEQTASVPGAMQVRVGDAFLLTGKLCAELSDHCRNCAIFLVIAVHGWIIGHPEKIDPEEG